MRLGGNLFARLLPDAAVECCDDLFGNRAARIERIVSLGQATPEGEWLDQDRDEWVVLLQGAAKLQFADEISPRTMRPGDWVAIAAHVRHRVAWTEPQAATVWLAVHISVDAAA